MILHLCNIIFGKCYDAMFKPSNVSCPIVCETSVFQRK